MAYQGLSRSDPLWYKDAIIYELHVRAFYDSNGDGIGDFPGLTQKLDYVQGLGVTALWLLPFYPSPLRDDGYDVADYQNVHPAYGTLDDFQQFMQAAHARGIRVIIELVANHTSDQHPWFQAARRARSGAPARDFYVWSDTDSRYAGTPIIFRDVETSNWTWDPVAGAYYWHRFFAQQPDLNYATPLVLDAMLHTMRFWFDLGVDGFRLDAIPYLCEREGTDNANLPETHAILKAMRRFLDQHYDARMFLAEVTQTPTDIQAYFGEGDECHMAYHFPLVPRLFLALYQEDRRPITDMLQQTPTLPYKNQWALFLRNHDALDVNMLSAAERQRLYQVYAPEPRMLLHREIRRRLAPLVQGHAGRIQLLHSLILSLPGTPILYYGDEIGMGDNVALDDRTGVRTPMQWSGDRNAGFSRADSQRLYAPVITDPAYGYHLVNVASQERDPASLLRWIQRMVALRKQHRVFGRGEMRLLQPPNHTILAYIRHDATDIIVVVANLSSQPQQVELDLAAYTGRIPHEMCTGAAFRPIETGAYGLTLGPYACLWLRL